jgi:hypothetical protein
MAPVSSSPVANALSAYQASFVADDAPTAQDRWCLEDCILGGIACLNLIFRAIEAWHGRVFAGRQGYSAEDEQKYRQALSQWLEFTRTVVLPAVERYEGVHGFNSVSQSHELRMDIMKAEQAIHDWKAPAASAYATFREVELNEKESRAACEAVREQADRPRRKFRRVARGG